METRERAKAEAAALVLKGAGKLEEIKRRIGHKYGLASVLKNSEILEKIPKARRTEKIMRVLVLRKVRTLSGISPIAVMTMSGCPHGRCTYCPRGEEAAQSYTGYEPASLRGRQNKFDAHAQVCARLESLRQIGHSVGKCELIVMGGTFNSQPRAYQQSFMKGCIDAMNGKKSRTLAEALKRNETAPVRAVGITFETRPDWAREKNVDELLAMGATRVELGVQTLSDEVYKKVHREHTVNDVVRATAVLKDSALKVCYHMMPGLWSSERKDVEIFKSLFSDERFRPDMLKIYPCLVLEGTELYEQWKRGEFTPYDSEEAADVIAKASAHIPPYCRVMRMQRDIPAQLIAAGVKAGNLRQLVEARMKELGIRCRCIRCREMGLLGKKINETKLELRRMNYRASGPLSAASGKGPLSAEQKAGGNEVFLSFEEKDGDALAGFLRLRIPNKPHRTEIGKDTALVRELHVYGQEVPIGEEGRGRIQHRGLGAGLLEEAEGIAAREFGARKMLVMSGMGAREYYRKFGYSGDGPYMAKNLAARR